MAEFRINQAKKLFITHHRRRETAHFLSNKLCYQPEQQFKIIYNTKKERVCI